MPAFAPALSYLWQANIVPSSVPVRKYVGSDVGKARHCGATSSDLEGGGACSSNLSWGCASISIDQVHNTPSVLQLMILLAFCVPTISRLYIGWVCPSPVRGVFWTGLGELFLVSQSKTCPL
jgi:hypothetical protein